MIYARKLAEDCANSPHLPPTVADLTHIEAIIEAALAHERERCARLVDEAKVSHGTQTDAVALAASIRALGPEEVEPASASEPRDNEDLSTKEADRRAADRAWRRATKPDPKELP